jgi:ribosomal protein S3
MGQKTNSTILNLSLKNAEWKSKYIEKNTEESSVLLYKNIEIRNYLNRIFKVHGLSIHNCKIEYSLTTAHFFITFFEIKTETKKLYTKINTKETPVFNNSKNLIKYLINQVIAIDLNLFFNNKTIIFKIQNLNQKFDVLINTSKTNTLEYKSIIKQFRRFFKTSNFKELIKILFITVSEKDSAKLLAETIARYFAKQKKQHGFLLFLLKRVLEKVTNSHFSLVNGVKIVVSGRFNGAPRANKKIIMVGKVPLQSFDSSISYYEETSYTLNGTFGIKVWISEKVNIINYVFTT